MDRWRVFRSTAAAPSPVARYATAPLMIFARTTDKILCRIPTAPRAVLVSCCAMETNIYDSGLPHCLIDQCSVHLPGGDNMMPCINTLVRTLGVMTLVGMASLSLPFPAQAGGVHVSIGVGLPVVVAPAPMIVQPAPVVVVQPAPVVVSQPVIVQRAPVIVTEPQVVY